MNLFPKPDHVDMTPDEWLQDALKKWTDSHPEKYLAHYPIEESHLPGTRAHRDAWEHQGEGQVLSINLEKARDLHKRLILAVGADRYALQQYGPIIGAITAFKKQAMVDLYGLMHEDGTHNAIAAAEDITVLYNIWPPVVDLRIGRRDYPQPKTKQG